MKSSWIKGFYYFLAVFSLGFALGTVRVLIIAPKIGEWSAVCLEVPIMLFFSWKMCRYLMKNASVQPWIMGSSAFCYLMIAEFLLSCWIFDRPVIQFFTHYQTRAGLLGLASQILFGAMPLILRKQAGTKS